MATDLTTLNAVKEWLGIPLTNTASDALLTRMIDAASTFIVSWLDRPILTATYTGELYDGNGAQRMKVRAMPITSVSELKVDRVVIPASVNGMPGYIFQEASIILRGCYRFEAGMSNVEVSYVAGYATVPPDIEQACIEMIGLRYKERERIGITSKGLAGETISFSQKDMSSSVKSILNEYKRVTPV